MRRGIVAIGVAGLVVAVLTGATGATSTGGLGGGQLVFHSELNGKDEEIYRVDLDKLQSPVNLTNNLAKDVSPAWSPNGTKIAFTSDRGGTSRIFLMDADGSNKQQFLPSGPGGEANPQLCTDTAAVFGAAGDVWVGTLGGSARNLTNSPGSTEAQPTCDPAGTRVLYQSSLSKAGRTLFDLPLSGGGAPRQLSPDGWLSLDPAVDPSGKQVLFFGQSPDGKRGLWENAYSSNGTLPWKPKLVLEAKPPREYRLSKYDPQLGFAWSPTFTSKFGRAIFGTDLPQGSAASTGTRSLFFFDRKTFNTLGYVPRFGEDANPGKRPLPSVYRDKSLLGVGGTNGVDSMAIIFGKKSLTVRSQNGPLARLFGDGKTVVRGGYSIAYDLPFTNILLNSARGADSITIRGTPPPKVKVAVDCGPEADAVRFLEILRSRYGYKNCEQVKRT